MKNSASIALLVLAAGLAAFVLMFEKDTLGTRERTTMPPISFDPGDARLISISRSSENLTLRNDGKQWLVSLPFEDRANQEICEELLTSLNKVSILETITSSDFARKDVTREEIDLAPGGGATITIFGGDGPLASLRIGRRGFLEESAYADFPGSDHYPDVYVLDSDLADLAARALAGMRDPRIFRATVPEVGRVLLTDGGGESLEVFRDPRTAMWRLAKPIAARADQDAVDALVKELCSLEIDEFLDSAGGAALPADASAGSISIWMVPEGFGTVIPLPQVGSGPEGRLQLDLAVSGPVIDSEDSPLLGKVTGREIVLRLPRRTAHLFEVDPASLRDRFLAQIPDGSIRGIVISSPGETDVMLSSNGRIWSSLRNGKWEAADTFAIEHFLKIINEEEILEYLDPDGPGSLEPFGLEPPTMRIGFTTSTVGAATELEGATPPLDPEEDPLDEYSLSYVLGLGLVVDEKNRDDARLFAKFASEPYLMRIDPTFLANVPDHPLKWKSRGVLSFNIVSLREIRIQGAASEAPANRLVYDFASNDWRLFTGDEELTARLDLRKTRAFADLLGSFKAREWISNREVGLRALKDPVLTVEIDLNFLSDDGSREIEKTATLRFSPVSGPGGEDDRLYFGRLDDSPEIFIAGREVVEAAAASFLKPE